MADRTYEKSMAEAYAKLLEKEGEIPPSTFAERTRSNHFIDVPYIRVVKHATRYYPLKLNDKYKHAMVNCLSAQQGVGNSLYAHDFSRLKEIYDVSSGANTPIESNEDMYANLIDRYLGIKYPQGDCDEMVQRYIKKTY